MLDQAFDALKTYDWGADPNVLKPISDAAISTREDAAARAELESRLAELLKADVPRAAKDYVCRHLMLIGTSASVPALAELLPQAELSHMARYALERNPAPEAAQALRDALPKLAGPLQLGVIASLASRGDAASIPGLAGLLGSSEAAVAAAAAAALGAIRSPEAAHALTQSRPTAPEARLAATDALLACAEQLLAGGKKAEALVIYKGLAGEDQAKHVRLAATRGMLACAGQGQ